MNEITHLRDVTLTPELAFKLTGIISAYRPHTIPPTKDQLGERIDEKNESTLEEIQRLQTHQSYHRQEYIRSQNQLAYQILSESYYEVTE